MTEENEGQIILLQDEFGEEHEFHVIDLIEDAGIRYVILQPALSEDETGEEKEDEEVYEAVIMRVEEKDEEEDILVLVEDDEEWDRVARAFEEKQEG